jgi:ATP phosphoribosyltransferase
VEAIFDITETGTTLIQNNLKIIDQVMESTAVFIANKESLKDPVKREKISDMIVLLRGVVEARKKLHIFVNVNKENLDELLNILPSLKGPTVSNLSKEGWYGVNTIINKQDYIRLIPNIRKIAQGLVTLEPSQILSLDNIIMDDDDKN